MTFLAYLLTILLAPTVGTWCGMLGMLFMWTKSPVLIGGISGFISGVVSCWFTVKIFYWLGVELTTTPLWVLVGVMTLYNLGRVGRSSDPFYVKGEIGQLVGFLAGVHFWWNHLIG